MKPYKGIGTLLITEESIDYINAYRKHYRGRAKHLDESHVNNRTCIEFNEEPAGRHDHAGYRKNCNPTISFKKFKKDTSPDIREKLKMLKI